MNLVIDQSPEYEDTKITIQCRLVDEKLQHLIDQIRLYSFSLPGTRGGQTFPLRPEEIYYFESVDDRTSICTEKEVYGCPLRLYEIENLLRGTSFIRISKSCVLNIDQLKCVGSHLGGRLDAVLNNGEHVLINRHYVSALKEKLGI